MTAWYNEIDPRAANTLEELIHEGLIAPGVVDRRSIIDVRASDLRGFTQCHFFAGIGVWSHALRRAGWPDDRPCWTGSCPCQPFSLAGQGRGLDDPRHLWPHWVRLIGEHRPDFCFGEQVASADVWLDLVRADMEDLGFAFAAPDLAAAGFAGAHIRQRFFWVADAYNAEWWADHAPRHLGDWAPTGRLESDGDAAGCGADGWVADTHGGQHGGGLLQHGGEHGQQSEDGGIVRLGLAHSSLAAEIGRDDGEVLGVPPGQWADQCAALLGGTSPDGWVGNNNNNPRLALGPWSVDERGAVRFEGAAAGPTSPLFGCDWLLCHDAKIRPVEAGTFPLAASDTARLGRLHALGNAIDAETLTQFISAYIDCVEAAIAA